MTSVMENKQKGMYNFSTGISIIYFEQRKKETFFSKRSICSLLKAEKEKKDMDMQRKGADDQFKKKIKV